MEVGSADTVLVICCEHLTEFRILEQSQTTKEINLLTAPDKVTQDMGAILQYKLRFLHTSRLDRLQLKMNP